MSVYFYQNFEDENLESPKIDFLNSLNASEIIFVKENIRSFHSLNDIFLKIKPNDILIISSLKKVCIRIKDMLSIINKVLSKNATLLILDMPETYECFLENGSNHIVLKTITRTILLTHSDVEKSISDRVGRPKLNYPENWKELYELWINKEISSKEFIVKSGLKKATFYNFLSEYQSSLNQ